MSRNLIGPNQTSCPMPSYKNLDSSTPSGQRTINKLLALRERLKTEIPQRTLSETLLLASWNIRDFDKPSYGYRIDEAYYYLAEIIAAFDIVAVQEIYKDLTALNRLIRILGPEWDFVFSDVTEGRKGNSERIAFIYDKRKIRFGGLAGELVIPPSTNRDGTVSPPPQFWRTPLICGFQAGWAKFMIANVHILYGSGGAESPERIQELEAVAKFLHKRTEDETAWARKLFLLGDFNIFSREDHTYEILTDAGFICPIPLLEEFTNIARDKQYDQILLRERENSLEVMNGGTFSYFETVFTDEEEDIYHQYMMKPQKEEFYKSYKAWRTHQMSDHLPLWVEVRIDYADEFLQKKLTKTASEA